MHKKVKLLFILLCCVFFLSGCLNSVSPTSEKIISPANRMIPLEGKWKITGYLSAQMDIKSQNNIMSQKDMVRWIDKEIQFSRDGVMIGEYIWVKPVYKLKRVDLGEYLLYRYGISMNRDMESDKEVSVVTVTSGDTFLYELVKLSDREAILAIDDLLYTIKKHSNEVDAAFTRKLAEKKDSDTSTGAKVKEQLRSCLLLGIRSNGDNPGTGYTYKTIWIAAVDRNLHPVLETSHIFLPRKNGFWKIESNRIADVEREEDILSVFSPYQLFTKSNFLPEINVQNWGRRLGKLNRKILFVGNDYISVEVSGEGRLIGSPEKWEEKRLQTLPIDNITSKKGVEITDVEDQKGEVIFAESALKAMVSIRNEGGILTHDGLDKESFSLVRKTGHWFLRGRIHYSKNHIQSYMDYNINLIPSGKLLNYDTLCLSWTQIKDRVPEAVDAYTSPNRDIAVIMTRHKIFVFSIIDGSLSGLPMAKLKIQEGDSAVMAEWARGDYVRSWEESFLKNEVRKVN